ncbi:MAG TPA: hypothetical protein VKG01_11980 [Thermoanaerobaculia bacterium]|nr:hypothetical protein [Thermoanaerobaculia bacterium]
MSLIDEALKRAELEAARRDGLRTGASPWVMESRTRRRRGWTIAALVFVLAAAGAGAFWIRQRSTSESAKTAAPQAVAQSRTPVPESKTDMRTVEVAPPPPVATPRDPSRRDVEARPAAKDSGASRRVSPVTANPTAPAAEAKQAAVSADAKSPRGLANGRTYVGEVSVPDAGKITLEGIVWSETNPIALVNGKVLPPGAVVEEFTIVSIQPDRVELKGRGVTIYLALK